MKKVKVAVRTTDELTSILFKYGKIYEVEKVNVMGTDEIIFIVTYECEEVIREVEAEKEVETVKVEERKLRKNEGRVVVNDYCECEEDDYPREFPF